MALGYAYRPVGSGTTTRYTTARSFTLRGANGWAFGDKRVRRGRARVAVAGALAVASSALLRRASPHRRRPRRRPKQGGEIIYGLEAETGGGWCPTSARLAISGIEVAAAIYDTLTVPEHQGRDTSPTWPSRSSPTPTSPSGRSPCATASPSTTAPRSTPTRWRRTSRPTAPSTLIGAALKNITDVTVDSPTQLTVTTGDAVGRVPVASCTSTAGSASSHPPSSPTPATCAENLIGTGPFKLESRTINQELVAVRNPDYWQKDAQGQPAPLPRQDHVQAGGRGDPARQLAPGRPARHDPHLRRPAGRRARPAGRPASP